MFLQELGMQRARVMFVVLIFTSMLHVPPRGHSDPLSPLGPSQPPLGITLLLPLPEHLTHELCVPSLINYTPVSFVCHINIVGIFSPPSHECNFIIFLRFTLCFFLLVRFILYSSVLIILFFCLLCFIPFLFVSCFIPTPLSVLSCLFSGLANTRLLAFPRFILSTFPSEFTEIVQSIADGSIDKERLPRYHCLLDFSCAFSLLYLYIYHK